MFAPTSDGEPRGMTFNDFFVFQKDYEYRTERRQRSIRSRDGSRARAAFLRRREAESRIR